MDNHWAPPPLEMIALLTSRTPVKPEPKLLADIIRMVLELLLALKLPRTFLFTLRLVSKEFNALITPLLYRHIVLDSPSVLLLVSSLATLPPSEVRVLHSIRRTLPPSQVRVLHSIRRYAQHVTLEERLPEERLERALDSLKYLRLVTNGWPSRPVFRSLLLNLLSRRPHLRLSIVDLVLDTDTAQNLTSLNPLQLVCCKILIYEKQWDNSDAGDGTDIPDDGSLAPISLLKPFLIGKENLETLHLHCTVPEVCIPENEIESSERLPAVKELQLNGYNWIHSAATAVQFWNWTRMTNLKLCRVAIVPFLETVKPEYLTNLRTFETDGFCPGDAHLRNEGIFLLCELLYGIKALENLTLSWVWNGVDEKWKEQLVGAIRHHGRSLRYLEFGGQRDFPQRLAEIPSNQPRVNYVAELRFRLVNIVELTLDNTTIWVENMLHLSSPSEPENTADIDYTTILAGFRNLRRLTIWMRPRMRARDVHRIHSKESMLSETRTIAKAWLERLVERKEGARFERVWLNLKIFYSPPCNGNMPDQDLVARGSYRYEGTLPIQEQIYMIHQRIDFHRG